MAQNGRKTRAECEKLGLSTKWVGGSGRPRHTPLTEQQLKKIAELLEYGMTVEDCAILCGISKDTLDKGKRVATRVAELASEHRREEIARMLSGAEVTAEARAAADKLLATAG